eukprot:TRINITY_DN3201_c0_g1_i1.p2 TRINITY_DN3201_c0_g1~~TRINITY_DN3201_c0_g1_i1.p2  ORF type:complete len:65 (+),score=9.50 TRINITY_DN3201_c0_g1_i1:126-320(+)
MEVADEGSDGGVTGRPTEGCGVQRERPKGTGKQICSMINTGAFSLDAGPGEVEGDVLQPKEGRA